MKRGKKLVVGAVVLLILGLSALTGLSFPGSPPGGAVPVARADDPCDANPPPPSLDCPAPTPTPK